MPIAQISVLFVYLLFSNNSGAFLLIFSLRFNQFTINKGVPSMVFAIPSTYFAKPKSPILNILSFIKTFADLKSLCIIFFSCKAYQDFNLKNYNKTLNPFRISLKCSNPSNSLKFLIFLNSSN